MANSVISVDPEKRDDMYYRYKMPAAIIKIEGSGNGIKTVIPNIHDICKVLKRPEEILLKFLGAELGAQATLIKDSDKYLVMGSFTQERMQELIYRFIEKYVLCKKCRNPETDVVLGTKQRVFLECRACSQKTELNSAEKTVNLIVLHYGNMAKAASKADAKASKLPPQAKATDERAGGSPTQPTPPAASAAAEPTQKAIESVAEERENPVDVLSRQLVANYNVETVAAAVFRIKSDYALKEAFTMRLVFRAVVSESEKREPHRFVEAVRLNLPLIQRFADKEDLRKVLVRECQLLCVRMKQPHKFMMLMKLLVEEGVIPDTEVYQWFEGKAKDVTEEEFTAIKDITRPFIEWLKAAD